MGARRGASAGASPRVQKWFAPFQGARRRYSINESTSIPSTHENPLKSVHTRAR
jgi:hypothetical protein